MSGTTEKVTAHHPPQAVAPSSARCSWDGGCNRKGHALGQAAAPPSARSLKVAMANANKIHVSGQAVGPSSTLCKWLRTGCCAVPYYPILAVGAMAVASQWRAITK
ncbi:hypothetical protein GOP47_0014946 [Adiantum capillus-veneris]|uniref:Uncharacterized protein n=1 Tax=Adiantum capillus-veneris TaxID=13818 RepID=A0A9D4UMF5_ADICA|nr:hypothetical protein GOP47_0014946 [Adiantum capillus-veneris]